MKIYIAQNAGFCFGVKEAINKAKIAASEKGTKEILTYGPLIHNNQVIENLKSIGVFAVDTIEEAKNHTMIIRSHGVPLFIYEEACQNNIEIIDATCPFVRKVQKIAKEYSDKGYTIIIIGNHKHPEVIGIKGWCNNKTYIIENEKDIEEVEKCDKICVVAQTTITFELWEQITERLKEKADTIKTFNTICIATKERQNHCEKIAKKVDAMIVIGGYHSSNTQKLVQISKKYCKQTYHIETASELPITQMKNLKTIGITAGASTPDWIIKEAITKMNDIQHENNDMMSMMEEIEKSLVAPRRGDTVKGEVIHVTDKEIMVNIGYKTDGIIPLGEISNNASVNPHDIVKEGDEIEVYILKTDDGDGNILLSKKRIASTKDWEVLEKISKDNDILEVKVTQIVKGGVIAVYNDIRGFIPASQLSTRFVSNLEEFVGKQMKVQVIDLDPTKRKAVFSHKVIMAEENKEKKSKLWASIEKDTIIEGEVKRITDFGIFVDIGGMDGLVHISDLSWGRVKHPSDVAKIGDKLQVKVIDLNKEKERVSLGLKQCVQEPWSVVDEKHAVGELINGKVVRLVDFGAFVEIEPGIDGLVHISQISDKHIAKASEVLHVGQQVAVKILELDKKTKRISLSIKEAIENENVEEIENEEQPTTIGEILATKE
ncbi:bifunctional 4-hydroxy-3-methylbut-2-enyl diphosphate reductase/30S ribosomal protein S1 [Lutibacter sp. B2]|nr:bifunctional 4-hydroxy-3-methylbut-2-enyl diphosphate reductase/30S ribosomal protein S1 [Lutibacter sp. B2]